jgi:8-hydroxy-5-deazaflavin:NADPH oxidoreductase
VRRPPTANDSGNTARADRVARVMTTIGFIGSGLIGSTLARVAIDAGYDVVLSNSRGPDTLADLVGRLGPKARAATAEDAAAAADIAVVTVPLKAYKAVPVEPLAGKVVIDTNNYYPERDGEFPELEAETTTVSELLQRHLPASHVVKAFNHIYFEDLASQGQPAGTPGRRALAIAGDDADAKATVTTLLDSFGYDTVDAGPLAEGWRFQRDTAAYGVPYIAAPPDLTRSKPAGADEIRSALAAAQRYADM